MRPRAASLLLLAASLASSLAASRARAQRVNEPEDVNGRDEWFWSMRSWPSTERPYEAMWRLHEHLLDYLHRAAAFTDATTAPLGGAWRSIGPNGVWTSQIESGRIAAILPATTPGGPMYVGTASGGVWRSTDDGFTWTPLTDTQCALTTGAMARDPSSASIVYVATGEGNGGLLGCGVLRTTDGGDTWTLGNSGLHTANTNSSGVFSSLVVDPTNAGTANTVLLGTTNYINAGVVRSTDAGASWTVVHNTGPANSLIAHPTKPFTYYVTDRVNSPVTTRGVYRSTDAGATWSELPPLPVADASQIGRTELAVSTSAPNLLWALVGNLTTGGFLGLFRYDENTNVWTTLPAVGVNGGFGTQQSYDLTIAVDPRDTSRIFIAGVGAFHSTDGGKDFHPWAQEVHADWHVIAFDPNDPDIMWVGCDGGVYVSKDAGATFISRSAGLAVTQFYPGITVNPQGTRIAGGSQDNGTHVFSGTPFWDNFIGGDGGYTAINYKNPSVEWGETQWSTATNTTGNIFRWDVTGSFTRRSTGISTTDRAGFIPSLVMDPVNPTKLYFGTFRLYRTTDEGASWTAISGDLSATGRGVISTIAVSPADTNTIWVGTNDGKAMVSRDGGLTFTQATGLPARSITRISPHPTDPARALITVSGFGSSHVFETTDAFATPVRDLNGNLLDAPANVAIYVPEAGAILVGTDVGVFQSADGVTWTPGPTGLPNVIVQDLVYQSALHLVVAGTYGRGMFAYDVGGSTAVLRGDASGDGTIDAFDALLIQQTLVGSAPRDVAVYPRGDANCNGHIDAADLVLTLRAAVGLPNGTACAGTSR